MDLILSEKKKATTTRNAIIFGMLENIVLNTLRSECSIQQSDRLLLGFSGGPDSVCLLDLLAKAGYGVSIAYFNHQLRPESELEEVFTLKVSERYQVESTIGSADIKRVAAQRKKGIETTARECRYHFLAETARGFGAAAIVVAHHADDQVETVLLNLLRGCGLNGLSGMPYRSPNEFTGGIPVVRPMIDIWKSDILAYCEKSGLAYQIDKTNFEQEYTRNVLRNETIPAIEKINPNAKKNILRMRSIVQKENEFLNVIGEQAFKDAIIQIGKEFFKVEINAFCGLPTSIQRRVLLHAIKTSFKMEKDVRYQLIEDIRSVLTGEQQGKHAQATTDIQALIEGEFGFVFSTIDQLATDDDPGLDPWIGCVPIAVPGETKISWNWMIRVEKMAKDECGEKAYQNTDALTAYFDVDAVTLPITARRAQPGDRYAPMGMEGRSMKVSDFWINRKVPRRLRKNWPLIRDANQILWIPGSQPAHSVQITDATRSVLIITLEKLRP
jgi:tRNA(Ile)-lysidine synthase